MSAELTPKKAAIQLLENADDNITFEQIMYELHVLQKIDKGLSDIRKGDLTSHDEVRKEFNKWLK
jgi:predicted transcriptional regulator